MSLYSVPFYPVLLGAEVDGLKLTAAHVLIIGAIIAHSNGKFNCCIAKIEDIADECGLSIANARNVRSALITAGLLEKETAEHSSYIISVSITPKIFEIMKENSSESGLKYFKKSLKGFQEILESLSEVETEVGDNITKNNSYIDGYFASDPSDSENHDSDSTTRMKPTTLKQQLVQIFKHKGIIDHQKALRGIQKLQGIFDDDTLLELARVGAEQKPLGLKDGSEWRPNFLWFTNPDNTEKVSNWAERVSNKVESGKLNLDEIDPLDIKIWDWAIENGLAKDYDECHSNWGDVLFKITSDPKLYKEWQGFKYE